MSDQCKYIRTSGNTHWCALAAEPRQWVGLTDEEVEQLAEQVWFGGASAGHGRFAKLIEAKLKEKNT